MLGLLDMRCREKYFSGAADEHVSRLASVLGSLDISGVEFAYAS